MLWIHTFSPAKMWIAGLTAIQKPYLHLHTQFNRDLPWGAIDMDFMNLNQAAHGDREFGFICTRLRQSRKVVVGHWQDEAVHDEVGTWMRAACGWAETRRLKVARFGDNMREVAVTEGDKVAAQRQFGYSVNGYGVGDLGAVIRRGRKKFLRELIDIHFVRNDSEFGRGTFRARGDVIEIIPAYENEEAIRVELWDNDVERISIIDSLTGNIIREVDSAPIYPAKYFVTDRDKMQKAIHNIELELAERLEVFRKDEKYLEAQRLEQRTKFDIEMMKEIGYCSGIENYSRHMDGRAPGSRPFNLEFDYFPADFLLVIDESHVTLLQIRGMYNGDRSRKGTLVEYGFRLPSALDNRPMMYEEFMEMLDQVIFVAGIMDILRFSCSKPAAGLPARNGPE